MPKPIKFTRSRKFGSEAGPDDIQPWETDEYKKYSSEEMKRFKEADIAAGVDVAQADVFSGQTPVGGSSSKGYKPESPSAAKQLIREKAGFDIDMEIEIRQQIHDEYQGKKMSIDIKNKPGVQAKTITTTVGETPTDYTSDVRQSAPSFQVTSEGIVEPQVDRPLGIKSKKPIGVVGMDLATQRKAFKAAEELTSLKIQRAGIVRDINKSLYDINYDADVLTQTDIDKAKFVSKAEGISESEAVTRNKQTATERVAEVGDAFEQKADWKQTSAYDYSIVEEGPEFRDYEKQVQAERFPMTTIEERIAATGSGSFKEYPKGGGRGGVTIPAIAGKTDLSGSGMKGGGVKGLGYLQAELLSKSIVPFKTTVVDNIAQVPFAVSDYERQATRILGKQKAKQHMKDIMDPKFQTPADPKAPSAIVSAVKDPDIAKTTPVAPIREGAAYEALLARHQKIEAAAAEFATIRKDVTEIFGSASKTNIEKYFQGKGIASSGAFRDVRSATLAGIDVDKLGVKLPARSAAMEKRISEQAYKGKTGVVVTGIGTQTQYGPGHDIKQEGPAGTKKPQTVVPNPDAPNYGISEPSPRRAEAQKKRALSLEQRAQKIISTPGINLSEAERAVQKELNKSLKGIGKFATVGAIKGLSKIMAPITKTNPALAGLSLLPKKVFDDILNPKRPEA